MKPSLKRRDLLLLPLAMATLGALADEPKVQSLDEVLRWLEQMERAPRPATTGAWPLVAVFEHLAQSVEMSMDGFPQPRSAMFQSTLGAAAFSFFSWRGRMSHGLDEPIPGAPALTRQGDWKPAAARLRSALLRFDAHQGALKRHFAYGALSKAEFARAHVFHVANHQDEIVLG